MGNCIHCSRFKYSPKTWLALYNHVQAFWSHLLAIGTSLLKFCITSESGHLGIGPVNKQCSQVRVQGRWASSWEIAHFAHPLFRVSKWFGLSFLDNFMHAINLKMKKLKTPSNPIIKKFMIYYKAEAANISYVQFKVTFFYIILKLNKQIPKYIKVQLAWLL